MNEKSLKREISKMPKIEVLKPEQARYPSFRLIWEDGNRISWETRVGAYLTWYKRFLKKYYGEHFYFEMEDVSLHGCPIKGRLNGVIYTWFLFQNEELEQQGKIAWDEFILEEQDNDPETAQLLICATNKTWIWRHNIGQTILPDGEKLKPLDGYILSNQNYRYYAGIYDGVEEDYFYLHNWKVEYLSWIESKKTNNIQCHPISSITTAMSMVTL